MRTPPIRPAVRRPGRPVVRRPAAVLAVAVLSVIAACGRSDPAVPPGGADRPPVLLRSVDLRLPLDRYQPTVAETDRLARAHRALLSDCMRGLGLDYVLPDTGPPAGPRTWTDRRYGLTDPAQAAHGYWSATRTATNRTASAIRQRTARATGTEGAAITGRGVQVINGHRVPAGGCAEAAQRRLTGNDPPGVDHSLAQRLSSDSFTRSQHDPRVVDATRRWSACMLVAGFRYAGPLDPPADRRFQHALSGTEIAAASADIACKRQTNLIGIWYAVEAVLQAPLIASNQAGLDLARSAFQAELAIAGAALTR